MRHFSRQLNCWSFRCSWSIVCRRCFNYIFILNLTPGFNGLGKDNYKMRRKAFKFWDLARLILETLQYSLLYSWVCQINVCNVRVAYCDHNYIASTEGYLQGMYIDYNTEHKYSCYLCHNIIQHFVSLLMAFGLNAIFDKLSIVRMYFIR